MDNGTGGLIANIGQLILDFVVGLIRGILAPLIENVFGVPAAD